LKKKPGEPLSTKSEKTYISVQEFISSWEKEVYELNNLDFFIFKMINHLGYQIEHNYFTTIKPSNHLRVDTEEIGTLSFNLGDGLESFLENNCFGDCSMSCPTHLDEPVDPEEIKARNDQLQLIQLENGAEFSKRNFFVNDILNYVIIDTLFDFYHYEMGLNLDDTDLSLIQFADFISSTLEKFIDAQVKAFLSNPKDSATELFNKLMFDANPTWEEDGQSALDDEFDESETWKYGDVHIHRVIEEYLGELALGEYDSGVVRKLLGCFQEYAEHYAGLKRVDEIEEEDLEEFFLFWLIREITLEREISPNTINLVFQRFFRWVDLSRESELTSRYERLMSLHFASMQNALLSSRSYFERNSVIDGVIELNTSGDPTVTGLFEIEKNLKNGLLQVRDILLNKKYINVQFGLADSANLINRAILSATIKPTVYGWRCVNLDYIFPQAARPYLT
jgi:hypothetical protein